MNIENITIEKVCLNHLVKVRKQCYECKHDKFNENCDNYKPTIMFIYEVKERIE